MKVKRLLSFLLASFLAFQTPMTLLADETPTGTPTPIVSSTGSVVEDVDNEIIIGNDINQDKHTEYHDAIDGDSAENYAPELDEDGNIIEDKLSTEVYVSQASSFSVCIPKTLILDGQSKDANYQVAAKGDIAGLASICVIPKSSFWMYDVDGIKTKQIAHTSQQITKFLSTTMEEIPLNAINGVTKDDFIWTDGYVYCNGITAGKWSGVETFVIMYQEDFTAPIEIASDGTIFSIDNDTILLQEEYKGITYVDAFVNGTSTTNITLATESDFLTIEGNGIILNENAVAGDIANIIVTLPGVNDEDGAEIRNEVSVNLQVVVFSLSMNKSILTLQAGSKDEVKAIVVPTTLNSQIQWNVTNDMNFVVQIDEEDPSIANVVAKSAIPSTRSIMTLADDTDATDDLNGMLTATVSGYGTSSIVIVEEEEICEHNYVGVVTNKATCVKEGLMTYTCNKCGDFYTEIIAIDSSAHTLGSDKHHCTYCGALIKQYAKGETMTKTVAGVSVNFVCIDANFAYKNEDGVNDTGALFWATTVMNPSSIPWNANSTSNLWAYSTARELLNGANSDTTYLAKVDTTNEYFIRETEGIGAGVSGKYPSLSSFVRTKNPDPVYTTDYFFPLTLEEAIAHNAYVAYFYGDNSSSNSSYIWNWYYANNAVPPFVYTFRSTSGVSPAVTQTLCYYFAGQNMVVNWNILAENNGLARGAGQRPAFVISQNVGVAEPTAPEPVVNYNVGDKISRTINGQTVTMTCVDENYADASGKNVGALFLADTVLPITYATSTNSWAYSNARKVLNGEKSDTTGLVDVNTTLSTAGSRIPDINWHWATGPNIDFTAPVSISAPATTDKYFLLSIEELCAYVGYANSTDGVHRDIQKDSLSNGMIGYALRTPYLYSSTNEYYISLLTNVPRMTNTMDNTTKTGICASELIGARPACVLPQS